MAQLLRKHLTSPGSLIAREKGTSRRHLRNAYSTLHMPFSLDAAKSCGPRLHQPVKCPLGLNSLRIPLARAHMLATSAFREAQKAGIPFDSLLPLGSLRRYSPDVGDVSLLAIAPPPAHGEILRSFGRLPGVTATVDETPWSVTMLMARGQLTVRVAAPDQAGAALVWFTGSKKHTMELAARANSRGYGFLDGRFVRAGELVAVPSEEDVYRFLELPFIPPELREGEDEIARAEKGALPQLVTDLDIRGDLHMHTTWSDGRDTVESMVRSARRLRYDYVAITDHSQHAMASRTLSIDDIPRQREEIRSIRSLVRGIEILHGVEVDILYDGTLDFPDELLEGFDIVLASLHDAGEDDGPGLTERYLRAIRHPLVNIITHPANRTPAMSPGYDLDFDALFQAAAETGTAMEVDGAPGHLDMDGALARRAVAAGVTIVIDSDCHRAEALDRQMRFGVSTARRGWVEPRHVLNTRRIDAVRSFVSSKRGRH